MVTVVNEAQDPAFTPFSFAILYGWIVYGILTMLSFFTNGVLDIHIGIGFLPPVLELLAGLFIVIGALCMIVSSMQWTKLSTAWTIDKIGMFMALGGWACYLAGVGFADPVAIGRVIFSLIFIVALIVRYIFTYTHRKFVRAKVSRLWKSGQIPRR